MSSSLISWGGSFKETKDDAEDLNEDGEPYSQWSYLPDLILEQVFAHLNISERYSASQVCRNWYYAFYLPNTWSTFVLSDTTLTRRKYNYYSGWQHILDHVRMSQCLCKVGFNFKSLILEPMLNFYNLFEFMNMMSFFTEQQGLDNTTVKGVGSKVKTLRFTFPCNMAADDRERCRLYGTGGKLLEALKRLMGNLVSLQYLELRDLMLDITEGQTLLDEVCATCSLTLKELILVNATEAPCQLLHVGIFLNLQVLVISPQNLGEDVLALIGQTRLRHLHILQNRFTPSELILLPVSGRAWQLCRKSNIHLSVHLELESQREREIIWQERAPVRSIIYNSPLAKIQSESIMTTIDLYAKDLRAYGHLGLPRFQRSRSFHDRVDALLLLLVRQSVWLHTLVIGMHLALLSCCLQPI